MSVIAWDGKTLSADRLVYTGGVAGATTKIIRHNDHLIGVSGSCVQVVYLHAWARTGFQPDLFPEIQKDPKDHATMMVIAPDREIRIYENQPLPWINIKPIWAIGIGRDFALGAMSAGQDSRSACEIAAQWCPWCGRGFDTVTFSDRPRRSSNKKG